MLDVANRFAAAVATVRVPNVGSFVVEVSSSPSSASAMITVSFTVDSRTASGASASEAVTCVVQKQEQQQEKFVSIATVINPSTANNVASHVTLATTTAANAAAAVTARFSKVPADKKATQNGPFRATLELFLPGGRSGNYILSNKKHGEVLADAHLQQLCYDEQTGRLFFVVRSTPPKIASLEEFVADTAFSSSSPSLLMADDSKKSPATWDVSSRYDVGEGYPQLFGTEIVSVQLPTPTASSSSSSFSSSPCGLLTQQIPQSGGDDEKKNLTVVGYPVVVPGSGIVFCEYAGVVLEHLQRGLVHCFSARATKTYASLYPLSEKKEIQLGGDCIKQLTVFNPPPSSRNDDDNSNNVNGGKKTVAARIAYFNFKSQLPLDRRPHLGSAALCVANVDAALDVIGTQTLVDVVMDPAIKIAGAPENFPGLFPTMGAGDIVWSEDGQRLFVSSVLRSSQVVYEISCPFDFSSEQATAAVTTTVRLLTPEQEGTWRLVAVKGDLLVCAASATTSLPRVLLRSLSDPSGNWSGIYTGGDPSSMRHTTITKPLCSAPSQGEILYHKSACSSGAAEAVERKKVVVLMHGGPHSTDTNSYTRGTHLLLECGFDIVSVNYRGSLGFGQRAVESLLGRVGTQDVSDVLAVVQTEILASNGGGVGGVDLFAAGGSHGGFLCCHLVGHSTNLFTAAAIRNPVTDIPAMSTATDIEDWCLTEAGAAAVTDSTAPQNRMLMSSASPIQSAGNVSCPILLGIGDKDLRVPPFQGRAWARAVRQNKHRPEVCLVEYPADSHSLDTPTSEAEFAIHTVSFFLNAAANKKKKAEQK